MCTSECPSTLHTALSSLWYLHRAVWAPPKHAATCASKCQRCMHAYPGGRVQAAVRPGPPAAEPLPTRSARALCQHHQPPCRGCAAIPWCSLCNEEHVCAMSHQDGPSMSDHTGHGLYGLKESHCECCASWVLPAGEWQKLAPFRILSVDIECAGRKVPRFPPLPHLACMPAAACIPVPPQAGFKPLLSGSPASTKIICSPARRRLRNGGTAARAEALPRGGTLTPKP